jgi:alkylation response protein AidB-like acyl-CoA dehydrogenase
VDFDYPLSAEETRTKIKAFLADNLPADWMGIGALDIDDQRRFVSDWRKKLYEGGWLGLSWPTEYGGAGLSPLDEVVVAEEFTKVGVPMGSGNDTFSILMLGNTLLTWGTEEQKQYFLPRALSGEHTWCQGYSEPDAGSDLASVGTRAVLDGDEWVINGQKTWTSAGMEANWIFALCRTDTDAPKHRGISFILIPMDQEGVEVRPIKMMSGDSEFNETFFTDARAQKDHVIGRVNDGWRVAMTLLGFERGKDAAVGPMGFRNELDRLVAMAKENGKINDPLIRDRILQAHETVSVMRFMGYGSLTKFMRGDAPGAESAINKLTWSEYHRTLTELAMDILGPASLVAKGRGPSNVFRHDSKGAPNSTKSWQTVFLNARAGTIYAGTSEIQRNIVGEMILGLPKDHPSGRESAPPL